MTGGMPIAGETEIESIVMIGTKRDMIDTLVLHPTRRHTNQDLVNPLAHVESVGTVSSLDT
jgi:hypothetical protein